MSAESMFSLGEIQRVREPPDDIDLCLAYNTPQALLRDLHRPSVKFEVSPLDFQRFTFMFDAGTAATKDTKAMVLADYRIRIEQLGKTNDEMVREFRALKQLLKKPWADAPKFGRRYLPAGMGNF